MARIRTIKPDFFTSPDMARYDVLGRLTFIGLWTHVDDAGRCLDEVRLIHAALFPLDDMVSIDDVSEVIDALVAGGQLIRYRICGRSYLQVVAWHHQVINRPGKSRIPGPDDLQVTVSDDSLNAHGADTEDSQQEGNREQGSGTGKGTTAPIAALPMPLPVPVEPATPAKESAPDMLFDSLVEVCGMEYSDMTLRQRRACGVARAELAKVGATPAEIHRRAIAYRQRFPQAALTPNALASQWATLRADPAPTAPKLSKSMEAHLSAGRRLGLVEGSAS